VLLCGVALAAVLARQYATVRDNSRLLSELAEREAELRHQAFHDGLTGLANRALFRDRVGHALELHRRDLRPLTVLFCDLDDFKVINDTTGTPAVTPCWCGSPSGCAARCAAATRWPGSAVTSSPCCSRTAAPARGRAEAGGVAAGSRSPCWAAACR
jgi:hypothetical protein